MSRSMVVVKGTKKGQLEALLEQCVQLNADVRPNIEQGYFTVTVPPPWKRTSAQGGMWGLISGMVIGLTRLGAKVYYSNAAVTDSSMFKYLFYDLNWLFFCGWMFLFCIIVVIAVSLMTEAPSAEKIQGLVFGTSTPEQKAATRASWNHWDIIHTVIILAITAAFYWYFW